ncbi:pyrimidine utilization flavin reductase protein F [Rhizobiaceae bacterium CRRU44]|uniref:FMN reductase (NADH) RutF n=2 Tax=Hyphomicrobiales TaxID=356 RepID=A0AA43ZFZ0_9HYPH|nr:pyrimidine utilization flavin reductase protein F [Ferranicluibacter rubi]NHT77172.1 pyrimidine utilization flavin reductase protein F [Ferranicluibacter rubi]
MPFVDEALSEPAPIDRDAFRNAMSRLGAAVNIITTDGPAGKAGFAASAVCSVTDTPPTLLVCLKRSSSVFETFTANRTLCVNTLAGHHEQLSALFGGKTPVEERFAAATWQEGETGAPILADALVSFDCSVNESVDIGTHQVLFCTVIGIHETDGDIPLIYYRRAYHRIGREAG